MSTSEQPSATSEQPSANDLQALSHQVNQLNGQVAQLSTLVHALVRALDTPQFRSIVESHLTVLQSLQGAVQNTAKRLNKLSETYVAEAAPASPEPSMMDFLQMFQAAGGKLPSL